MGEDWKIGRSEGLFDGLAKAEMVMIPKGSEEGRERRREGGREEGEQHTSSSPSSCRATPRLKYASGIPVSSIASAVR